MFQSTFFARVFIVFSVVFAVQVVSGIALMVGFARAIPETVNLIWGLGGWLLLSVFSLGGMVIWLRDREQPLVALHHAAQLIHAGQFEVSLDLPGGGEFQTVGAACESLAKEVQRYTLDLEKRVAERTEALAGATREIFELTQQLEEENIRMGAELDVTRRIQQMLLPRQHEFRAMPTLDIAGFMEAADEVGGDYYDVLERNGRVLIGIGDVTGHGLESGMIMLMAQTAVRTLLTDDITDPTEFLNVVNRTLHDNIQRMNCDKNLTLTLLDYCDGTLSITGQHEEVLIIRNSGEIESVDTSDLGFMVGFQPDIADFIQQEQIPIAPGEGVVLYTDGIPEALNLDDELYGMSRMMEVIREHHAESAQEIQQAIIADLWIHMDSRTPSDDITLLVIKRKA